MTRRHAPDDDRTRPMPAKPIIGAIIGPIAPRAEQDDGDRRQAPADFRVPPENGTQDAPGTSTPGNTASSTEAATQKLPAASQRGSDR